MKKYVKIKRMSILKQTTPFIVALGLVAFIAFITLSFQGRFVQGSIQQGQEYTATTTAPNVIFGNTITGDAVLKTGPGGLGSVVITGAATGILNFYDATTTNVDLRTGNKATSTILIASLPASLVAGDYVFDVAVSDGLLVDLVSGNMPTTTITYR